MKHTDYPSLTAMIDRKTELEKQLYAAQSLSVRLSDTAERLTPKHKAAQNAVNGYRLSVQNGANNYQSSLHASLEESRRLKEDLDKTKQEQTEAKHQIDDLKAQLAACNDKVGVQNMLDHQQAIAETQNELHKFQQLIAGHQQAIQAASIRRDGLPPLLKQRGELLADIALGENKADELAELDNRIAALREEQTNAVALAQQTISQAQQTIDGLEPRLRQVQRKLAHLESLTPKMLDMFFMEKAQQAAHEFTTLADKLVQKTTELRALKEILEGIGQRGKVDFFAYQCSLLTIPCIEGATPLEHLRGDKGAYLNAHWEHLPYAETLSQIKQGLIDQGIAL